MLNMQPIIVAVDFSNTSIHAIEYAISMANKMKSDIHLIWVDKVNAVDSVYPDNSSETRNEAKSRFEEIIAQYGKGLVKGISMDYKLKKGRIYREVDNLARLVKAELIVTGAHGISGYEEFWIGSNAYKIVNSAINPVITVRHDFPIAKNVERILVPMDGSMESLQKIPFVVKLATLFQAEVHLITTHSSHLKSIQRITQKISQTALAYLQKHQITVIEDSLVGNDLTKAVLTYAETVKADQIGRAHV